MSDSPSDESLHQPHDKLFKVGFSDPATTSAFLQAQLPPQLSSCVDWQALTALPDSFVDSHYQASHTDLLFSTQIQGHPCLLYLLFEHQSTEDPFISLRLLRYLVRIWEAFLKDNPTASRLPIVLPVVLMHNAEAWEVQTQFSALFDLPEAVAEGLKPFLPDFSYHAIQLAQMPYEAIPGTPVGILILRVMKAYRQNRLLDEAVWDEVLLSAVPSQIFEFVLRYILDGEIDKQAFETNLKKLKDPKTRQTAMTLAQHYRQEGRQEGICKGLVKGRQDDVIAALEIRFERVPEGLKEAIRETHDESHLSLLHKEAILCRDLEAFSAAL